MAVRVPFMGGEMEAGHIAAVVEAEVVGVVQDEQTVYEGGRKSDPSFTVILNTPFESFNGSILGETLPSPLETGDKYTFVLAIRNNSSGLATQPRVRIVSYRPGNLLTKALRDVFAKPSPDAPTPAPPLPVVPTTPVTQRVA